MNNVEIDLLKETIGLKDVWLYTSHMIIMWGKSITAPHFSMKCGKKCIIIEPVLEGFEDSYIQWNRIVIHQADMPKDAEYGLIKRRNISINRLSSRCRIPIRKARLLNTMVAWYSNLRTGAVLQSLLTELLVKCWGSPWRRQKSKN